MKPPEVRKCLFDMADACCEMVWGIVEGSLPKLKEEIQQLLEED